MYHKVQFLDRFLFLLYFNDFEECLHHAQVVEFADDTVLYVSSKFFHIIEEHLNEDLICIHEFLNTNKLIINLNKEKSESMIFGTAKRLAKCPERLDLFYNSASIASTKSYKYLGTKLDPTLSLKENFKIIYKNASSKLNLQRHDFTRHIIQRYSEFEFNENTIE